MKECKCYITNTEVVIIEQDNLDIIGDAHNCDQMGCSSVRHVCFRFRIADSYQTRQIAGEPRTIATLQAKLEQAKADLVNYGDNLHACNTKLDKQAEEIARLEDETTDLNNTIGFMQTGLDDWKAKSDKQAEEIERLKEALHRIQVWTEPNFKVITSVMSTIIENAYDVANKALLKGETE